MSSNYNVRYGQRGYDERWDRTSELLTPTIRQQECQAGCLVRCYYSYDENDYICEGKLYVWLPIILIAIAVILIVLGICAWRIFRRERGGGGASSVGRSDRLEMQYRKDPYPPWQGRA